MKRTGAMKFFAVVVLASAPAIAAPTKSVSTAKVTPRTHASGSPACGNVDSKQAIMDPACDDATADTTPVVISPAFAKIETRARAPRTARAPAQPSTAAKLAVQPVATPPAARLAPRTLKNGRPACGNLGGKAPATMCDPATGKLVLDGRSK